MDSGQWALTVDIEQWPLTSTWTGHYFGHKDTDTDTDSNMDMKIDTVNPI